MKRKENIMNKVSVNPSALVEYKTIDTLVFIEKIFKESEIEGLSMREVVQVLTCVQNLKRHLLEMDDLGCPSFLYKHYVYVPLKENNNQISIKKTKGE
tara:strand:+ start:718 stop:1011 length:294 start_codon:yes stop_codon:yes gene_type:complete